MELRIPRPMAGLFRPRTASAKEPKDRRPKGVLVFYDADRIWTGVLALEDLTRRLPVGCSYYYDPQHYNLNGAILGISVGILALGGAGWMEWATPGAIGLGVVGGLLGLLIGWLIIGPALLPKPRFMVRRQRIEDPVSRTVEGSMEVVGQLFDIEPIVHAYLRSAVDPSATTGPRPPGAPAYRPGVYLGSTWDSIIQAKAARRFFISSLSGSQVIQLAAPVVVAVCSIIVVFFFVMANKG